MRNLPCTCGSGKKFKRCCGATEQRAHATRSPERGIDLDPKRVNGAGPQNGFVLQYHAVLLYDLLGQSQKLRGITQLPSTAAELAATQQLLRETAGSVLSMRTHMRQYYSNVRQPAIDSAGLAPADRALFEAARQVQLTIRNFSDMTVATVPLREMPPAPTPMASVFALLGAAASMMLVSLASRTPIRGAIDVGLAIDIEGDEIYGPILDQVYQSETQTAKWPRIVVGPGLVDYLLEPRRRPHEGVVGQIHSGLAEICQELIALDSDGLHVVDYLGPGMKRHLGGDTEFAVIELAAKFAQNEHARFREQGNCRLAERYEQVQNYCNARVAIWK